MNLDLLKEYLKQIEECQLLELLDISSEEIIEMFEERIIEKRKFLEGEFEVLPIPQEQLDEAYHTEYEDDYLEDEFDEVKGG